MVNFYKKLLGAPGFHEGDIKWYIIHGYTNDKFPTRRYDWVVKQLTMSLFKNKRAMITIKVRLVAN